MEHRKKSLQRREIMELPVDILSRIDVVTLLAMAAMFWIFNSRLDKKFEKIDQRFDKIEQRFDKVDQRMDKIENRLSLVEHDMIEVKTILRMKESCMLKDSNQMKKAE